MRYYLVSSPWWIWHVIEEFREVWPMKENFVLLIHVLSYVLPLGIALILRRYAPRIASRIIVALVVLALVVNTWNVIHGTKSLAVQDARSRIEEAATFAGNQLSNKNRKTTDVIVLDQVITKIVSQIYVICRADYPELRIDTVSLHLILSKQYEGKVWNAVQAGRESKDIELLDRFKKGTQDPGSFAAAAIAGGRKFCPDVRKEPRTDDCSYYELAPGTASSSIPYRSLACLPVRGGAPGQQVFATVCLTGDNKIDWSARLDSLDDSLRNPLTLLNEKLAKYRELNNLLSVEQEEKASPQSHR